MKDFKTRLAFKLVDQLAKTLKYKLNRQWFRCWLTYYLTVKPMYIVLKVVYKDKSTSITL